MKDYFIEEIKSQFIVDETQIKIVGSKYIWLWIVIEPENRKIVGLRISKEKNMFVIAERFLSDIVDKQGKYPISTDGGTWYPPQACRFLKLNHHLHSFVYKDEKSFIERTMQYIKDKLMKDLTTTFHVERRIVN